MDNTPDVVFFFSRVDLFLKEVDGVFSYISYQN
jgi:hypothetical protein